jgi:hypothetical protein
MPVYYFWHKAKEKASWRYPLRTDISADTPILSTNCTIYMQKVFSGIIVLLRHDGNEMKLAQAQLCPR